MQHDGGGAAADLAEHDAFRLGRLVAAENVPYFMHALFAAAPVAAPGLGTFAVDAYWRLYLDPDLLIGPDRWDSTTIGAVLAHEVGHLLRDHAARADALPAPVHQLAWNLAGDAEINDDLVEAGVPLPDGVVTPSVLGCPEGDLAETYYEHLTRHQTHLPRRRLGRLRLRVGLPAGAGRTARRRGAGGRQRRPRWTPPRPIWCAAGWRGRFKLQKRARAGARSQPD